MPRGTRLIFCAAPTDKGFSCVRGPLYTRVTCGDDQQLDEESRGAPNVDLSYAAHNVCPSCVRCLLEERKVKPCAGLVAVGREISP